MSQFQADKYIPTIDAILSVSDLEQVSVKRLRGALEALFDVKFLNDDKKLIKDLILERYESFENGDIQAVKFLTKKEREEEERKSKPTSSPKKKNKKAKSTQHVKDDAKPRGWSAITFQLSPELADVLDSPPGAQLSRPECVKKIWEHIKANNLQNPSDKREILCDEKMAKVFGNKVHMFTMNKLLGAHLYKEGQSTPTVEAKVESPVNGVKREFEEDGSINNNPKVEVNDEDVISEEE